ncbi:MAG: phosphoglycerate dehydrogenase [Chloroflexi bacterium]|nr:MAG: phosphoglycerate dehydrogenase [Chloroflexota bacterium]
MSPMFHILITDDISPAGLALLKNAPDVRLEVVTRPGSAQLLDLIRHCDAVITRSATTLDATVFAAASQLKVAGRAGAGLDNVDVDAATRAGVLVMNTPEANTLAATEHAFALLLALCRDLPEAHASLKRGEWQRSRFMGVQLYGKTLGVIGFGRVGSRVAARAQAFGMEVIAYDPYIAADVTTRAKVERVPLLEALLARADFISLHMPLTAETRRLVGADQLAALKPGARLVNCARGELVDESALLDALESGALAGAALDVFGEEPPRSEVLKRLIAHPHVVATPHIAASTVEAQADVGVQIARQVLEALRGENYQNAVNVQQVQDGWRTKCPNAIC